MFQDLFLSVYEWRANVCSFLLREWIYERLDLFVCFLKLDSYGGTWLLVILLAVL